MGLSGCVSSVCMHPSKLLKTWSAALIFPNTIQMLLGFCTEPMKGEQRHALAQNARTTPKTFGEKHFKPLRKKPANDEIGEGERFKPLRKLPLNDEIGEREAFQASSEEALNDESGEREALQASSKKNH
eukprot:4435568-Pleurochrysis_carterae.AAC.4